MRRRPGGKPISLCSWGDRALTRLIEGITRISLDPAARGFYAALAFPTQSIVKPQAIDCVTRHPEGPTIMASPFQFPIEMLEPRYLLANVAVNIGSVIRAVDTKWL